MFRSLALVQIVETLHHARFDVCVEALVEVEAPAEKRVRDEAAGPVAHLAQDLGEGRDGFVHHGEV